MRIKRVPGHPIVSPIDLDQSVNHPGYCSQPTTYPKIKEVYYDIL